jgi:hypothetical protein
VLSAAVLPLHQFPTSRTMNRSKCTLSQVGMANAIWGDKEVLGEGAEDESGPSSSAPSAPVAPSSCVGQSLAEQVAAPEFQRLTRSPCPRAPPSSRLLFASVSDCRRTSSRGKVPSPTVVRVLHLHDSDCWPAPPPATPALTASPERRRRRRLLDECQLNRLLLQLRSERFAGVIDPEHHSKYLVGDGGALASPESRRFDGAIRAVMYHSLAPGSASSLDGAAADVRTGLPHPAGASFASPCSPLHHARPPKRHKPGPST